MTRKRVKDDASFRSRWKFNLDRSRQREIAGLALFALGGLVLLVLLRITPSTLSERLAELLFLLFGWGAFALPLGAFVGSAFLLRRGKDADGGIAWGRVFAAEIFFAALLGLIHLLTPTTDGAALANQGEGGGFLGWAISQALASAFGDIGAGIILLAILLFTLPALLGLSAAHLSQWSESLAHRSETTRRQARPAPPRTRVVAPAPVKAEPESEPEAEPEPIEPEEEFEPLPEPSDASLEPPPPLSHPIISTHTRMRRRATALPSFDLFDESSAAKYGEQDAGRKAKMIEETLANFGIPAKVIEVNAGPTITQFGLEPGFIPRRTSDGQTRQRKVSVSRISALQHDLELALAAAPIRIETPVPGRPIVGIEVPNQSVSVVSLRSVVESESFKKKKSHLKIALGQDVSGTPVFADLASMPHLLIAGATGSGKSVCINAIIACLLLDNSPDDLRMIMVDPKRVELVNYNGIPHLLGPVVVEMEKVVPALRWVVAEMDARFMAFAQAKVRNIESYNQAMARSQGGTTMPYMVVLIDELADLMLAAPDETEKLLTRLAQMARATGIHLVIATQRPSVDVVTGLIKANFPSRISFAVTSSVDSRVVLDTPGAEKLLGRGDMLYMASDSSKLSRLQGCYVSDEELARLVHFWRDKAITDMRDIVQTAPWEMMDETPTAGNGGDELLAQATVLARKSDTVSISFLQRKLGIGYPRAARLMDQLEAAGVVSPDEGGGKPRAVLPPPKAESAVKRKR